MLVISMMMVWRRLDNVEYSIQDRHSERDTGEDREIRSARSLPTTLDRVDNDKQQVGSCFVPFDLYACILFFI